MSKMAGEKPKAWSLRSHIHGHIDPPNERSQSNKISTTKYLWYTWLPVSLGEQFYRIANVYFLGISILMLIGKYAPSVFQTPLDPWSTIGTFVIVLSLTCLKEGNEDLKRANDDRRDNEKPVKVITFNAQGEPQEKQIQTCEIKGGDIIKLEGPQQVPADMLLCITSNYADGNQCYIETANIDGETNLKLKNAPSDLTELCPDGRITPELFEGHVEFEPPNAFIYNFIGAFHNTACKHDGNANALPLGPENVLLRSSLFTNTDWGYGIALYTGQETKIQMNNQSAVKKMSGIEHLANKAIALVFSAQCILCTATVISVYALGYDDHTVTSPLGSYVYPYGRAQESDLPLFLELWFIFFLLFNNFIPISLYVTIEMINVGQGMLIAKDEQIYDAKLNCPTNVKTPNLAQELGMVSNIFSDKTGTLTCNEMRFVKFIVEGVMYDVEHDGKSPKAANPLKGTHLPNTPKLYNFLQCLATCHTVVREKDGTYRAESPDELALVEGADKLNCSVKERGTVNMDCELFGERKSFSVLAINAFNSERKRMSIVLKASTGEYYMMCKGADNIMIPLCQMQRDMQAGVEKSLLDLANLGLRTLCVGMKKLDTPAAEAWLKEYSAAAASMEGRAQLMDDCAARLEKGMELLGITAIEDRLQDEVPAVIASLADAGIVLWMLTGDKEETAINIGRSCNLLEADTKLFMLVGAKAPRSDEEKALGFANYDAKLREIYEDIEDHWEARGPAWTGYVDNDGQMKSIVLVMDGPTFAFFDYNKKEQTKWFLTVGKRVRSVIACRLTPNQKQSVVHLVKANTVPKATCLSIGDGANDVSMILEADVGVGIFGKEGRQAANNADFAIGQFKFLRRLLLVHGRWNYVRQASAFMYSLHKNAVITFLLFWYCYLTSVSGTSPFNSWVYAGYNLILGLPPVFFGILDRDLSADFVLANPETYATGQKNVLLSGRVVASWVVNALCYAVILCAIFYYALAPTFATYDLYDFGTITFTGLVFAMQTKLMFMHHQWAYPQLFFMGLSIVGTFFFYWVVQYWTYDTFYGAINLLYGDSVFWTFGVITVPIIILLFESISYYSRMFFNPTNEMLYREINHKEKFHADCLTSEHYAAGLEAELDGDMLGHELLAAELDPKRTRD